MQTNSTRRTGTLSQIPRGIWMLGFVSMFMDISSEIIHSLLPMFLVTGLGASAMLVGLIEGVAEATTPIVKMFSGALSDYLGNRKWLAVIGYGMGALSKPLFALAPTAGIVLTARVADRIGKGVRGAPRDALVADITPPHLRGAAYGLRQALDTVGAFLGPLLAVGLMLLWADNFRRVFWVAAIPGLVAVTILIFGIKEPAHHSDAKRVNPMNLESLKKLSRSYWWVVFIGAVFTLARFSEAFLVLRAMQGGVPIALVPLVMVAMNLVYSVSAYPFGKLADSMSHTRLLAIGLVVLITSDVVLAQGSHWPVILLGVALWGLHMGLTQGLLATMVAHAAPPDLKGTAFGFFNLMSGLAMLVASVVAGELWDRLGASTTFYAGAGFCIITLFALAASTTTPSAKSLTWHLLCERIGIRNLLVAGVLVIGGVWLFLGVLEDVISGDPLVAVDVKIYATLQTIRFPLLDSLMVAASELGDAAVTVPVILVVLAWLVWQRRLRSAAYWISAVVFAQLFVVTLKFFMRRARPSSMYEGLQGFSFPSNHATLSVVTYGFLAFFVARAWDNDARRRIATATALFILLISFSRLYLGAHWFSDVLAGLSFGVAWIATAAVLHHIGDEKQRDASSLGVASFVAFLTSATIHIIMQHGVDLSLYAPR